jgi:hypothetical protein
MKWFAVAIGSLGITAGWVTVTYFVPDATCPTSIAWFLVNVVIWNCATGRHSDENAEVNTEKP